MRGCLMSDNYVDYKLTSMVTPLMNERWNLASDTLWPNRFYLESRCSYITWCCSGTRREFYLTPSPTVNRRGGCLVQSWKILGTWESISRGCSYVATSACGKRLTSPPKITHVQRLCGLITCKNYTKSNGPMITETGEQVRKFIAYLPTKPRGCVSSEFMICDYNPIELLPEVFILTEIAYRACL